MVLLVQHFSLLKYLKLQETEVVKQQIIADGKGLKGECRARRAGKILDVTSDGYYNTAVCLPDFVKVWKCLDFTVTRMNVFTVSMELKMLKQ